MNIEDSLMNKIRVPDMSLDIKLIDKKYGNESGAPHSPLEVMTVLNLKGELAYYANRGEIQKGTRNQNASKKFCIW